jgi:hypothetical protein
MTRRRARSQNARAWLLQIRCGCTRMRGQPSRSLPLHPLLSRKGAPGVRRDVLQCLRDVPVLRCRAAEKPESVTVYSHTSLDALLTGPADPAPPGSPTPCASGRPNRRTTDIAQGGCAPGAARPHVRCSRPPGSIFLGESALAAVLQAQLLVARGRYLPLACR